MRSGSFGVQEMQGIGSVAPPSGVGEIKQGSKEEEYKKWLDEGIAAFEKSGNK